MSTTLEADTFDDLLHMVFERLIAAGQRIRPSRGPALEETAVLLRLTNPRARLSRSAGRSTVVSALGELCWYLHGSDDVTHVAYYVPQYRREAVDGRLIGAYGPRLFGAAGEGQLHRVIEILKRKPDSRQAVVQLFDADDLSRTKDVPCTCTLQFLLRGGRLELVVHMRSNDAFLGLPHDLFAFTMLQELVARSLAAELGTYSHFVGSLHLYDERRAEVDAYLSEGWFAQSTAVMPSMPVGDPWAAVTELLETERQIRLTPADGYEAEGLADGYWGDLAKLLAAFRLRRRPERLPAIAASLASPFYGIYVTDRIHKGGATS
ncbi:thymidylate synthase [Microbacterium sp. 77mftsu3.1]|uniref:thymidylate synthase n=1 Tax=Microbacterium sp. 77mftsu3.1 TaxID=1761802 RepID=UPI0003A7E4B4|nr:thymidylate synthase [Microbacterium sp. 77mftsu3.1]SDG32199.1 thymidylate synthase [Microbacterium sp. 77mftsu3.1]